MKRIVPVFLLWSLIASACAPLSLVSSSATEEPTAETFYDTQAPVVEPTRESVVQPTREPVPENGQTARQYIETLTSIGSRVAGTTGSSRAEQYIAETFTQLGYQPEERPFTATSDDGESIESANVVAVKNGTSSQMVVVGAHYDGVDDGLAADDNASGVAVMLEVAALVKNESIPYTIDFVAFGAEEAGLLGSYAFVSSLDTSEVKNIVLFVNLDSISAGDFTYVYSPENEAEARDWTLAWAAANGYDLQTIHNVNLSEDGYATGDYDAFQQAGIPWIYFEATNWTLGDLDGYTQVDPQFGDDGAIFHTRYDNLDYIDRTFPGRVDQHLDLYVNVLFHILTEYHI